MTNTADIDLETLDARSKLAEGTRPALLGSSRSSLEALCESLGEPSYRGRQIFTALHRHRAQSIDSISNIPRSLRESLLATERLGRPTVSQLQSSTDGTRKYLFASDGDLFEAVYIPEVASGRKTNTLCVSSQTGCAIGCTFCFTASLKRNRNLTAAEIVGQVIAVRDDVASLGEAARVTNVVFMGMGEPLLNYNAVVGASRILMDSEGSDFSSRRITVSTAGIIPRIKTLGADLQVQLAVSLNATTDEVRDRIMPINKKWPIAKLMKALRAYPLPPRRRITIEYVLLDGVNDSLEDARRLPKLLADIPVKVNLLPLNAHDRTGLRPPPSDRVAKFQAELREANLNALIRTPRGSDISAACGQLGGSAVSKSTQDPESSV